jgi:hypothetical protein
MDVDVVVISGDGRGDGDGGDGGGGGGGGNRGTVDHNNNNNDNVDVKEEAVEEEVVAVTNPAQQELPPPRPSRNKRAVPIKREDCGNGLVRCPRCGGGVLASERGCNVVTCRVQHEETLGGTIGGGRSGWCYVCFHCGVENTGEPCPSCPERVDEASRAAAVEMRNEVAARNPVDLRGDAVTEELAEQEEEEEEEQEEEEVQVEEEQEGVEEELTEVEEVEEELAEVEEVEEEEEVVVVVEEEEEVEEALMDGGVSVAAERRTAAASSSSPRRGAANHASSPAPPDSNRRDTLCARSGGTKRSYAEVDSDADDENYNADEGDAEEEEDGEDDEREAARAGATGRRGAKSHGSCPKPKCRIPRGLDLATLCENYGDGPYAHLLTEFAHPTEPMASFSRASHTKVPWKCGECANEWEAMIGDRTSNDHPQCRTPGPSASDTNNLEVPAVRQPSSRGEEII